MSWASYHRYMSSDAWRDRREEAFQFFGRTCSACGSTRNLEVHHRTYERFGREPVGDLQVLCGDCHIFADIKRRRTAKEIKDWPLMESWAVGNFGSEWWKECDHHCHPEDPMTRKRQNQNWKRPQCDNCGRFIGRDDIEDKTARQTLIPSDPGFLGVTTVTLCKHCNAPVAND